MASLKERVQAGLVNWFSSGHADHRTPTQLEREKYVLWHPSTGVYKRWMGILPAIMAQVCLGSFYSSSVFNKWADLHVWGAPGRNAGMFTACVLCYGLGTIIFGSWVQRHGAFYAVRRSLLLTPLGWLCASLATSHGQLWLLYGGYGLLHGLGCAHAYISTTAMLQQWYPDLKGFMSGLAVCGAGVGSAIWTSTARMLMDPHGDYRFEPPQVQMTFAILFAVLLAFSVPFLRTPPPGWTPPPLPQGNSCSARLLRRLAAPKAAASAGADGKPTSRHYSLAADKEYTFLEALRQQEFGISVLILVGCVTTGAVFLSSAADMTVNLFGFDSNYAAQVTAYLNTVNFVGRFAWGWVTDKVGRKVFWLLCSGVQCVALLVMTVAISHGNFSLWLLCFLLIGSLYGGSFGTLPAYVSDLFTPRISAATHGCLIGVWSFACVTGIPIFTAVTAAHSASVTVPAPGGGGGTVTVRTPLPEAYIINALWLAVLPAAAFVATLFLTVRREDRILRKGTGAAVVRWPGNRLCLCYCRCNTLRDAAIEDAYAQYGARAPHALHSSSSSSSSGSGTDNSGNNDSSLQTPVSPGTAGELGAAIGLPPAALELPLSSPTPTRTPAHEDSTSSQGDVEKAQQDGGGGAWAVKGVTQLPTSLQ